MILKKCIVYIISDCKKDILILWDNSVSVGKYNFRDVVLPFLIKLVNSTQLNVAKNGTHLGFITFSNENRTRTLLNIGTKNKTEAKDLISWLMKLNYKKDLEGNQTYTGKAFKLANDVSQPKPCCFDYIFLTVCASVGIYLFQVSLSLSYSADRSTIVYIT